MGARRSPDRHWQQAPPPGLPWHGGGGRCAGGRRRAVAATLDEAPYGPSPPGRSVATTVARGSLLVTPSAASTLVVASTVAPTVAGGALATSPVTTDGARSASVVVATASPAWSARRGHRQGQHPHEHQADRADSHDQQPSATGRRLRRRPRQLGRMAPRTLVWGQRSVRHRIANLLTAAAAVASRATTATADRRIRRHRRRDGASYDAPVLNSPATDEWLALSDDALPVAAAYEWAVRADCGAVVLFSGTVRDHADGRDGSTHLAYEAYEEQVVPRLAAIAAELRQRWPTVGRVALLHRTGRTRLSASRAVVVVVSAPHRDEAFEAARFGIDTLKASVPIWKHETWADGAGLGPRRARARSSDRGRLRDR